MGVMEVIPSGWDVESAGPRLSSDAGTRRMFTSVMWMIERPVGDGEFLPTLTLSHSSLTPVSLSPLRRLKTAGDSERYMQ
jgi:hypothetical protein